jgi:hypothetical protein
MQAKLLVGSTNKKRMSAIQKKFNATVKRLEKGKRLLERWKKAKDDFEVIRAEKYRPVIEDINHLQEALVYRFDEFYSRKSFSNRQKEKMAYFITETCDDLLAMGKENEQLKAIFNKYSEDDYDELVEEEKAFEEDLMRDILSDVLDIELEDDEIDLENLEETARKVSEKVREREAESSGDTVPVDDPEEKDVSASVKAVYRRLAASLHPDREQDSVERERKTELMQKVTTAYREKDLLQLLELQLEIEQIDQEHIDTLSQQTLTHYVSVLERQVEEVSNEVEWIVAVFRQMAGLDPYDKLTPKQAIAFFHEDIEAVKKDRQKMQIDLDSLTSVKRFQDWLRDYNHPDEEVMFDLMFDEMMAGDFPFGNSPVR